MTKAMMLLLSGPERESRSSGRKLVPIAVVCLCLLFAVGTPAQPQATTRIVDSKSPMFTTFEAPGALNLHWLSPHSPWEI